MVHQCKVQCYTMDTKQAEDLGLEDDGKWLPFIFTMDMVDAAKSSSDEEGTPTYNCTTIFTVSGGTFIIDTPYEEFFKKFVKFNSLQIIIDDREDESEQDEDLDL